FSDCQLVVTEGKFAGLAREALGDGGPPLLVAGRWDETPAPPDRDSLEVALADVTADDPEVAVGPDDLALILFTSGTTDAPRGVLRSPGRLLMMSLGAAHLVTGCTTDDVVYCVMPLFHANAQILGLGTALAGGAPLALARRFHKSRFLADVRRH